MLDKRTEALRNLLQQANELERQMIELERSFANVRRDFEAMFAEANLPAQENDEQDKGRKLLPPKPHLHDPRVVDMAFGAMAEEGDTTPESLR